MKISTILDNIDAGTLALPEFQRGFVWNRDQVKKLMTSLYKRHPVGSMLVWQTRRDTTKARGQADLKDTVDMLLDGQQRITSLYGIIRGKAPRFFEGDASAFTDLYFDLEKEVFEFYGPVKMAGKFSWIDVTRLMKDGIEPFINELNTKEELREHFASYMTRLSTIEHILDINIHVEEITGEDKTTEVVVDIFNEVNSGGTKLSKGDLALAKICGSWPEAREVLQQKLQKWEKAGFSFKMDWLLRCINAVTTGEARFYALDTITTAKFEEGIEKTERAIDKLLNTISSRLGLDHFRVLGSVYSFPVMCRYIVQNGMSTGNHRERDKLLYWYVHTILWGRYAGSTESVLDKDLKVIDEEPQPIEGLITELRQNRGDLTLYPSDFRGYSRGARFYPMLYMLTRVWNARDWDSGDALKKHLLGNLSNLQLHHIFPKAYLYDASYDRFEVNALANMTFLTQETNLRISDKAPEVYFPEIEQKHPGILKSHWIPMEQHLWKKEHFREFLTARQALLADASNTFLNKLRDGEITEEPAYHEASGSHDRLPEARRPVLHDAHEEQLLQDTQQWLARIGLPEGEWNYEVFEGGQEPVAVFDLAWPDGLQVHLSQPVTLLIDASEEARKAANRNGFRFFTSVDEFKSYVNEEIMQYSREV